MGVVCFLFFFVLRILLCFNIQCATYTYIHVLIAICSSPVLYNSYVSGFDTGFFAGGGGGGNISVRQHFGNCIVCQLCLCFGNLILYLTHTKNYAKADFGSHNYESELRYLHLLCTNAAQIRAIP